MSRNSKKRGKKLIEIPPVFSELNIDIQSSRVYKYLFFNEQKQLFFIVPKHCEGSMAQMLKEEKGWEKKSKIMKSAERGIIVS